MMNKICFAKLLKPFVLLGVILAVGIVFAGCSPKPQDVNTSENESVATEPPAVTVTPVKVPEKQAAQEVVPAPPATVTPAETSVQTPPEAPAVPPAVAPAPEPPAPQPTAQAPAPAQTPEQPAAAAIPEATPEEKAALDAGAELIAAYKAAEEGRAAKTKVSAEEKAETEKTWAALLDKCGPPLKLNDEASLVAASLKGPAKEGGQPYFLYLLFKVTKAIKKDYVVTIEGVVDPSFVSKIMPADREFGYARWSLDPKPPTSQWKKESLSIGGDSYMLVVKEVLGADIPYKIRLSFNSGLAGQWARVGDVVQLPWMVAE